MHKKKAMINLFKLKTKRKSLVELSEVAIHSSEAGKMSGGYKEYKPTIYNSDHYHSERIKTSQLLGASDEFNN